MIFSVDMKPTGKGRPRFTMQGGRVHTYTPQQTKDAETLIASGYLLAGGRRYDGAVQLGITAVYKIPKKTSKSKQAEMLMHKIKPQTKPDIDNVVKLVLDALNGIAYRDDKQVVSIKCGKIYGESARMIVEVEGECQ